MTYPSNTVFSIGPEIDTMKMADMFPEYIIAGNIDPLHFLQNTPKEVFEECCALIDKMSATDTRFVLMPGCDIPPNAPPVCVHQMLKASIARRKG